MAHGDRYVLPATNVCNEFYDLDGEKFSTSRNHLIWARDLLSEVPRDLIRFFLALTAPAYTRTNFNRETLRSVTSERLVRPWNQLAGAVASTDEATPLPTTAAGRRRCAATAERFRRCYGLPGYSPARAAETIAAELERLCASAPTAGDLLLEVRTLLAFAAPVLVDVAEEARAPARKPTPRPA
jgi:methionyl-tRNA synthetase